MHWITIFNSNRVQPAFSEQAIPLESYVQPWRRKTHGTRRTRGPDNLQELQKPLGTACQKAQDEYHHGEKQAQVLSRLEVRISHRGEQASLEQAPLTVGSNQESSAASAEDSSTEFDAKLCGTAAKKIQGTTSSKGAKLLRSQSGAIFEL